MAAMPPSVASAPGSTAKNSPSWPSRFSSAIRCTPAWTRQSRSSALSSSTASIAVRSSETPPWTGSTWPSSELPAPNGITGTPCSEQMRRIAATSSVLCAKATASGSRGAKRDSSRLCRPSTDGEVAKRSPSSSPSAVAAASFTARRLRSRISSAVRSGASQTGVCPASGIVATVALATGP